MKRKNWLRTASLSRMHFDTNNMITQAIIKQGHTRIEKCAKKHAMIENKDKCSICIEEFAANDNMCVLDCMHVFHHYCLNKWFQECHKCPLCKTKIKKII